MKAQKKADEKAQKAPAAAAAAPATTATATTAAVEADDQDIDPNVSDESNVSSERFLFRLGILQDACASRSAAEASGRNSFSA